ncbi:MAG: TraB/GumN family protein [Paludibacteraceae bacterium]|nr:TraB/GumN family protein [Paludibacteraceae bacterium]
MAIHKKIYLLLFTLGIIIPSHAQLLYEISGNGIKQKSYLFATNRLTDIQFLDSIPNLFKVYGKCNKIITEMSIHDFEAQKALQQAALLPDSITLRQLYSFDEYRLLQDAFMLNAKLDLNKLGRMKPAYLLEIYRTELLHKKLNYDENRSSENFFQTVAMQQGIPVLPLDNTGEAIYMIFDREPQDWQQKQLLQIVKFPEREIQLEKRIKHFYQNGLLNELSYEVSMPDNLSTLSYSDCKVFWQRNLTWVKRLRPYLEEGNCLICLNALYLGGDNGLIALLKNAGYKVKKYN